MTTPEGPILSVLVADDDPLVRRVLRMALESQGYRVTEAGDATEAMALSNHHADLVILDVNMPGGTVHETITAVRRGGAATPILVLSGEALPPADLPPHLTDFARKPIDLDDLLARVRLLLLSVASSSA